MNHTLVVFTHSENSMFSEYIENQLESISEYFPDLVIEYKNENDDRLIKYCKIPNRFPCYMLFKGNRCKTYINSKMDNTMLKNWIINKIG